MKGVIYPGTGKLKSIVIEEPGVAIWKSMTRLVLKKYGIREMLSYLDELIVEASDEQWAEKKWLKDKTFPKRDRDYKLKRKSAIKLNLKKLAIKKQINDNLKIIEVARSYGIVVKGKKAICPFHEDKDPSLLFYEDTNTFNCFGCKVNGDIVEFIRRCENEMPKM